MKITVEGLEQQLGTVTDLLREKAKTLEALPALRLAECPPAETLVVCIDLNKGFAEEGALCSKEAGALVGPAEAFLRGCREKGYRVLAYSDRHTGASPELDAFPPHCMEGTEEWKLAGELEACVDQVVYKNSTNGFLAREGNHAGPEIKHYIVIGCLTEICVYQYAATLRAWLNEHDVSGAEVIVPAELVDSYDAPGHPAFYYNLVFGASLLENGIRVVSRVEL